MSFIEKRTKEIPYYLDYKNKTLLLKKCKVVELKNIAKQNRLKYSGTKPILIHCIEQFFIKTTNAIQIQKVFRGKLTRTTFKMRGPAINKRDICVNTSDGYTLEPLNEIPYCKFFSYSDAKDFVYGFDVTSLIHVYNTKGKIMNPYNMEVLDANTVNNIISLGKKIEIVFKHMLDENEISIIKKCIVTVHLSKYSRERERIILQNQIQEQLNQFNTITHTRQTPTIATNMQPVESLYVKMQMIRSKPIYNRIIELFIEIDLLGNYTHREWFSTLNKRDYYNYYRYIQDIWRYRAHMTDAVRKNICQLCDPFRYVVMPYNYMAYPIEELQTICITVMENMVYGGVDIEYRKIGAMHVLSALTLVSNNARMNIPWLYESLV